MRRLVFSVIAASGLLVAGSSPALADDPAPTVSVKATPGKKICKIVDTTLDELSGLVATASGFVAIDDGSTQDSHKRVFFLNSKCKIVNRVVYSGSPIDTEDLILSPDGKTLWIADTGDDGVRAATPQHRDHIALWSMKADGSSKPKIYRIAYPSGDYHDAEALLLQNGTTPLLITKELGKPASIYEPSAPLKANNETSTALKKVGELAISGTTTPANTVAQIGNKTIDGGAIAPGGAKVALRTYTDALEWDVSNGDVLSALKNKPRTTGLPNEPFGEAITYSPDGRYFYTVSDMNGDHDTANYIMQYTPATTVATVAKSKSDTGPQTHWYSNLTLNQIMLLVGGVGLIGLILVGVGVLGIVRSRKQAALDPPAYGGGADPSDGDPETELIGVGGAPQRPAAFGARSGGMPAAGGGSGANSGAVYGGAGPAPGGAGPAPAGAGQRGPVYGGGGGGAPQYTRPAGGQQPPPRGGQPDPARGPQQPPARGGQQPPRGPQPAPGRGGAYGGGPQPGRGPAPQGQRPPGGGQGRGPAPQGGGGQGRGPAPQGGGGQGRGPAPQGGQRPPQGGGGQGRGAAPQGGQPPRGGGAVPPGGGGRPQRPQGGGSGQRPQGGGTYGRGNPPRGGGDGRAEYNARPEGRFDNPRYR